MRLGYLAVSARTGETVKLTKDKHPRKQLLEALGVQHCEKMYYDTKSGESVHCGYIARGDWWGIYEVHQWKTGNFRLPLK